METVQSPEHVIDSYSEFAAKASISDIMQFEVCGHPSSY